MLSLVYQTKEACVESKSMYCQHDCKAQYQRGQLGKKKNLFLCLSMFEKLKSYDVTNIPSFVNIIISIVNVPKDTMKVLSNLKETCTEEFKKIRKSFVNKDFSYLLP